MAKELFDVHIAFEADADARETADRLLEAFGRQTASLAPASTISSDEDRVVIHFHEVPDAVPPGGSEFDPPREEEPLEAAGREAIERLEAMHQEPTPLLPIVRALVALSAARARAGLSPRQRITIEVEPGRVHSQEELRHA